MVIHDIIIKHNRNLAHGALFLITIMIFSLEFESLNTKLSLNLL